MIVYKLTDRNGKTRLGEAGETQWGEGIEHVVSGGTPGKCGEGWLHAYHSPAVASMMNAVHAGIDNPVCWKCDADVVEDQGDKLLCTRVKTIHVVHLHELPVEQRVDIAVRAAMAICSDLEWNTWATGWISGLDRSKASAWAAWEKVAWGRTVAARALWAVLRMLQRMSDEEFETVPWVPWVPWDSSMSAEKAAALAAWLACERTREVREALNMNEIIIAVLVAQKGAS